MMAETINDTMTHAKNIFTLEGKRDQRSFANYSIAIFIAWVASLVTGYAIAVIIPEFFDLSMTVLKTFRFAVVVALFFLAYTRLADANLPKFLAVLIVSPFWVVTALVILILIVLPSKEETVTVKNADKPDPLKDTPFIAEFVKYVKTIFTIKGKRDQKDYIINIAIFYAATMALAYMAGALTVPDSAVERTLTAWIGPMSSLGIFCLVYTRLADAQLSRYWTIPVIMTGYAYAVIFPFIDIIVLAALALLPSKEETPEVKPEPPTVDN